MKVFGCVPKTLEEAISLQKNYIFCFTMKERYVSTSCIEVQLELYPYTIELDVMKNH